MSGVNNIAHAGGFAGGLLAGLGLSFAEQKAETGIDRLLASSAVLLTVASFGLALWTAVARG
jgi:hypothetical protein